jgi:hypothetical protein
MGVAVAKAAAEQWQQQHIILSCLASLLLHCLAQQGGIKFSFLMC